MRVQNFIHFSVVVGFFLGLVFSVLKFNEPESILLWTVLSTLGGYLIALLFASIFIACTDLDICLFDKKGTEESLLRFNHEFKNREKEVASILNYIRNYDFDDGK
ncbi:hypothetical protein EPC67_01945 [Helicobacter pylori]|uniref:Membrane protein n=7 Tax=Helicobacter pylori TaxID=210 RepID=A0A083YDY1_HELPX|nr:hypothetical protein [Helicobacter pylori]EJB37135.1 hypothetical protein HPNQ4161_0912 [Helicobacter pylori NQ4161]AKE81617.1 membrane protein [Helicobacter pylori J99]ANH45246.1 membrane protein [Helicobacter pylori]ANH48012.1 membrane protein [Helicobacter pylori]AVL49008.1 hypothetical protein CEP79_05550 [Helicobacter pylori]